jgi:HIV Tat-specific factor 1
MAQREYYYSNGGGTQQGPLEIGGVQRLFSIGSITAATAFWYQGMSGWLPLPQLPELASAVGIAAAQLSDASQQVQSAAASASGGDHSGAGADPRYTTERGLTVFTDPSGTKTVWDDARQEWLPYEQAMYMLGDAEAPAAPKVEDMEAKLEATRPLDEVGQELKAKAEIEERIKAKEAKKKGLPVPGKRAQPAESAKVNLEAAAAAFKADARERFVGSETFTGPRSGYVFNCGGSGTGYYLDLLEVSKELLLKRKADGGLTEAERIRRNKKKTDWRKQKKATTFQAAKINTNVFVQGLPVDTTTERLVEYFSKCGLIRRDQLTDEPCVKLYKDGVTGAPKGEGLVSFEKEESVDLAIELLDGDQNMAPGHTLRVTPAEFTQKGEKFVPKQRCVRTRARAMPCAWFMFL